MSHSPDLCFFPMLFFGIFCCNIFIIYNHSKVFLLQDNIRSTYSCNTSHICESFHFHVFYTNRSNQESNFRKNDNISNHPSRERLKLQFPQYTDVELHRHREENVRNSH